MTDPRSFVWYELVTPDAEGASRFYADVVGWRAEPVAMPGATYTIMSAGPHRAAGIMALPEEMRAGGGRPGWIGYVGVADADAAAEALVAAGGAVHRPPDDIPGTGRFAVVADPQGAVFTLFQPAGPIGAPPPPMTPGTVGWHELYADDWEAAFAFYAALFGWTKAEAIPMGPMGTYQLFAAGAAPVGGMMDRGAFVPAAVWGFYFAVAALDAAVERLAAGGGTVLNGPMEVPGGAWIVNARDPQGVAFSLVAPRR
jgi:predicted enzyme related to lactoylglutathione lyase